MLTRWKFHVVAGSLLRHHLLLFESRLHQNLHPTTLPAHFHLQLDKAGHSSRHRRRLRHWPLACHIGLHRMCPSRRLLGLELLRHPRKEGLLPPRQRVVGECCFAYWMRLVHHGSSHASSFQTEATTAPKDGSSWRLCFGLLVSPKASTKPPPQPPCPPCSHAPR